MRRVIVAFQSQENCTKIKDVLARAGLLVEDTCHAGSQVINMVNKLDDVLLICGNKLVDMSSIGLLELLPEETDVLMLLPPSQIESSWREGVFTLPLPVNKNDLLNTINMIFETKRESVFKKKIIKNERSAEGKEIVERAKLLLIEKHNMTENQAHRFIQKRSMDSASTMVDTALIILSTELN